MTLKFIKIQEKEPSEELIIFLKKIFPDINKNRWVWEYRKNPEKKGIAWIVKKNNVIIAHYAFILGKFYYKNKSYVVAKAEGSLADIKKIMKLPKQERRVFKELVLKSLEDLKKNKVDIVYGFPNSLAIKSQVSAGYNLLDVPIYLSNLIIDWNIYLCRKKKFFYMDKATNLISDIFKFLYVQYFTKLISNRKNVVEYNHGMNLKFREYTKSLKSLYINDQLEKIRNFEYIKWRFFENPYRTSYMGCFIKNSIILGHIIVSIDTNKIKNQSICHIMDMKAHKIDYYKELITWAIHFSLKKNITSIDFWSDKSLMETNQIGKFLLKCGFTKRFKKVKKKIILISFNKALDCKTIKFNTMRYLERL